MLSNYELELCCGYCRVAGPGPTNSGSGLDPDSIGSVDPDPGGQKLPTKVEFFCLKFMF
jgi:hypothetical protein